MALPTKTVDTTATITIGHSGIFLMTFPLCGLSTHDTGNYEGRASVNIRHGSLADIGERIRNVRFTPNTGRWTAVYEYTP